MSAGQSEEDDPCFKNPMIVGVNGDGDIFYLCGKNVAKVRSKWDPHDVSLDYGKMEVKFLSGKSEDLDYIRVPFHSYEKMVEWSQKNPESGCCQKSLHVLKRFFGAAS